MESTRAHIRDTSGQDRTPASTPGRRNRLRDPRMLAGLAGAVLLGLVLPA